MGERSVFSTPSRDADRGDGRLDDDDARLRGARLQKRARHDALSLALVPSRDAVSREPKTEKAFLLTDPRPNAVVAHASNLVSPRPAPDRNTSTAS